MLAKTTSKDFGLALAVTLAGGAALFVAQRAHWHVQEMSPGVEGCLTATVLGFVLALLHPLSYPRAVAISAPLVVGEYLGCAYAEAPAVGVGMVGLHLVIMGFIGVALSRREPQPAARTLRAHRPFSHRPADAHPT